MKTKTLTFFITSLFLVFTGLAVVADPIDPANYPGPVRVACVGDSITQGVGADPGKSYPDQLQLLLGDKWKVSNFGVSGRTLLKKGDFPYWKENAFKDAQNFKPDVVIILLGANDSKPANWQYQDQFSSDYKELIETFKNLGSHPHIFICRPTPAPEPGNYGINEKDILLEIAMIDQLAIDEQVDTIDMHAALADKPALLPDRVHPSTAGALVMAQTAAAALTGKPATP